jgi:hypothetical protein
MQRHSVSSSNLESVGYEASSQTLEIAFLSGSVYQYYRVPERVYVGLLNADSKGTYLDTFVKKAGYAYRQIA